MQDLIRFIWRGALGGAIVPALFYAYYMRMLYGSPLFRLFFIISLTALLPGALVGAVLWLCARFVDSLSTLLRISIGVTIGSAVTALWWLYAAFPYRVDLVDIPRMIFWILFDGASIGAFAGWLCPAETVFRREPELTYWERVREYEAAQAERDYWLAQKDSEKSRKNVRSN